MPITTPATPSAAHKPPGPLNPGAARVDLDKADSSSEQAIAPCGAVGRKHRRIEIVPGCRGFVGPGLPGHDDVQPVRAGPDLLITDAMPNPRGSVIQRRGWRWLVAAQERRAAAHLVVIAHQPVHLNQWRAVRELTQRWLLVTPGMFGRLGTRRRRAIQSWLAECGTEHVITLGPESRRVADKITAHVHADDASPETAPRSHTKSRHLPIHSVPPAPLLRSAA